MPLSPEAASALLRYYGHDSDEDLVLSPEEHRALVELLYGVTFAPERDYGRYNAGLRGTRRWRDSKGTYRAAHVRVPADPRICVTPGFDPTPAALAVIDRYWAHSTEEDLWFTVAEYGALTGIRPEFYTREQDPDRIRAGYMGYKEWFDEERVARRAQVRVRLISAKAREQGLI